MARIGETLKQAREAKQLTLRDVEAATKIRLKYLEALENENFKEIPGRVYCIGFLKTYAKFLELEDLALVEEYKAANKNEEFQQSSTNTQNNYHRPEQSLNTNKIFRIGMIFVAIALLFVVNHFYQQNKKSVADNFPPIVTDQQDQNDQKDQLEENIDEPGAGEDILDSRADAAETITYEGVNVQIKIVPEANNECWIKVLSDGKQVFTGTLVAGEIREFTGERLVKITFGNAGAAEVVMNGENLGLMGNKAKVVTKEFKI